MSEDKLKPTCKDTCYYIVEVGLVNGMDMVVCCNEHSEHNCHMFTANHVICDEVTRQEDQQ